MLFPRRGRCRKRGRLRLPAVGHPLVSWEIIPLADSTHGWTPNNSRSAVQPALAIPISSRWCCELSRHCCRGPRAVRDTGLGWGWGPLFPSMTPGGATLHRRIRQLWQGTVRTECTDGLFHNTDLPKGRWLALLRPVYAAFSWSSTAGVLSDPYHHGPRDSPTARPRPKTPQPSFQGKHSFKTQTTSALTLPAQDLLHR